jgi:hypothetical protein
MTRRLLSVLTLEIYLQGKMKGHRIDGSFEKGNFVSGTYTTITNGTACDIPLRRKPKGHYASLHIFPTDGIVTHSGGMKSLSDLSERVHSNSPKLQSRSKSRTARPLLTLMWGGIGAGKTTAAALFLDKIGKHPDEFAELGVDDLIELLPGYQSAIDSDDAATRQAAYLKYRKEAKALMPEYFASAVSHRRNIYVEWTYEGNLKKYSHGECPSDWACSADTWDSLEDDYDVTLVLIWCPDIDGIVENAAKRDRQIPEETIRKYNLNRAKHFVEGANTLFERKPDKMRAFVIIREQSGS